jgi:hypothetical protein
VPTAPRAGGLLVAAREVLRENTETYAETTTREMGKPISQAVAEVVKCPRVCDYDADVREAGYPAGVVQNLCCSVVAVHEQILLDRRVRGATLTGTDRAGAAVAATTGEHLTDTVLELGGSDRFLVLADADVEAAVETGIEWEITDCFKIERGRWMPADDSETVLHSLSVFFEATDAGGHIAIQPGELDGAAWFRYMPERLQPANEQKAAEWEP